MARLRFQALNEASQRKPIVITENSKRSDLFGENVFNENTMRQYLTEAAFKGVMSAIDHGTKIDQENCRSSFFINERVGFV